MGRHFDFNSEVSTHHLLSLLLMREAWSYTVFNKSKFGLPKTRFCRVSNIPFNCLFSYYTAKHGVLSQIKKIQAK